jgi:hypothetical protein
MMRLLPASRVALVAGTLLFVLLAYVTESLPSPSESPLPEDAGAPTPRATAPAPTKTILSPEPSLSEGIVAETPREAIVTYHELITTGNYTAAYQLLSPARSYPETLEAFVERKKLFAPQYEILTIESYQVWAATITAGTPTAFVPEEGERCRQLLVEFKVEWGGIEGANPAGTDSYVVVIVRGEQGWQLAEINNVPVRDACAEYEKVMD